MDIAATPFAHARPLLAALSEAVMVLAILSSILHDFDRILGAQEMRISKLDDLAAGRERTDALGDRFSPSQGK
nr:hypothetical protein DOP62_09830 [Synechococcus elongatus PCC 11801]